MRFSLADVQFQTFLLRLLNSAFLLASAGLLFGIAEAIDNSRLNKIIYKVAVFTGAFFLARIVAGILDSYLAFDIGWFSNLANTLFWGKIVHKLYGVWAVLRACKNEPERIALRETLDVLLDKLESAKRNLQRIA